MGYYCRECESYRPNEAFSRKGRKQHVCKRCIRHRGYRNEIRSWLKSTQLSKGNMKRLKQYMGMSNEETISLATLVYRVGEVAPEKMNRVETLKNAQPELLSELEAVGLLGIMKRIEQEEES